VATMPGRVLTTAFLCLSSIVRGLIDVTFMEVVDCADKFVCQDGKNLRIVFEASAIEMSEGEGTITGIVTGGQMWSDDNGDWELLESLMVEINYTNALWEYQLEELKQFSIKTESWCGPASWFPDCDTFDVYGECESMDGMGLGLTDGTEYTKHSIDVVEAWGAAVSIQSTHLDISWDASYTQHTLSNSFAEIHLDSTFDTISCFKNASTYYVVVPYNSAGSEEYHFISTEYWNDNVNNFDFSDEAYQSNFDCNLTVPGWHTIIPFYGDDDAEYIALGGGSNPRTEMSGNQLYAFSMGYIPSLYAEVVDVLSGGACTDLTSFIDATLGARGPPDSNKYIVSKSGIVDHFEMTLDLDYTTFVKMPTVAPTPGPTQLPTKSPTPAPSKTPTGIPTHSPVDEPTNAPTSPPSKRPTVLPSQSPTDTISSDSFDLYETAGRLEIVSTSPIAVSSTMQHNIEYSIANSFGIGREYVRLDSASWTSISINPASDPTTTAFVSRRLLSESEELHLSFTIQTTSIESRSSMTTKFDDSNTIIALNGALKEHFPDIQSIYIDNNDIGCGEGFKQMTIMGMSRCDSICGVNQYYDTDESSCTDQIPWDQESVEREAWWIAVVVFFVWFVFAGTLMWLILRAQKCMLRMAEEKESSKKKKKKRMKYAIESNAEAVNKSKVKAKKPKKKIAKKSKRAQEPSEESKSERRDTSGESESSSEEFETDSEGSYETDSTENTYETGSGSYETDSE